MLDYDKSDKIGGYIYFYKNNILIAVYNPFVGLAVKNPQFTICTEVIQMEEKIKNSINFLRSAYIQAKQSGTDKFQMDSETIKIIYDLLKDLGSHYEGEQHDI